MSNVPIGSIVAWAGHAVPTGWCPCDGSEHKLTGSADPLYAVLGDLYGTAKKGFVRLPDYRGLFLRGEDKQRPDEKGYKPSDSDRHKVGDGLGSRQGWAIGPHQHKIHTATRGRDFDGVANEGSSDHAKFDGYPLSQTAVAADGYPPSSVTIECRPINIAVKWIIYIGQASDASK